MSQHIMELVEKAYLKSKVPTIRVGDTVDVHTRIVEGDKEREQIFNGVVIARRGRGTNENFIVRRIVGKQGVERTFMLHSPNVLDVVTRRQGKVRRAKLYFLRDRVGKARRLREVRAGRTREAVPEVVETDKEPALASAQTAMDPRRTQGRHGERITARFLRRKGYRILARNYRCPQGEIDLIALDGEVLVFVEVKSRSAVEAAEPESNYQPSQQRRAAAAAQHFLMESRAQNWPSRFDLVSVYLPVRGRPVVDHFVSVFERERRF